MPRRAVSAPGGLLAALADRFIPKRSGGCDQTLTEVYRMDGRAIVALHGGMAFV